MPSSSLGDIWSEWMSHAEASLGHAENQLNAMNVFPVQDSDTGTNLLRTVKGISAYSPQDGAQQALKNAAGNSGMICATWLQSLVQSHGEYGEITPESLHVALFRAYKSAEGAVGQPADGTILTVMHDVAQAELQNDVEHHVANLVQVAFDSARGTEQLLEVAKSAHTTDAGASGFYLLMNSLCQALAGFSRSFEESAELFRPAQTVALPAADAVVDQGDEELICSVELDPVQMVQLRQELESAGDSLVISALATEESHYLWKIHVHGDAQALMSIIANYAEPQEPSMTSLTAHPQHCEDSLHD